MRAVLNNKNNVFYRNKMAGKKHLLKLGGFITGLSFSILYYQLWSTSSNSFSMIQSFAKANHSSIESKPKIYAAEDSLRGFQLKDTNLPQEDPTSSATSKIPEVKEPIKKKLILFWDEWFDTKWSASFPDQETLERDRCPSFQCEFTYDRKFLSVADAVMFTTDKWMDPIVSNHSRSSQRWVIVEIESPATLNVRHDMRFVANWTMTYHSSADVLAAYGYFTPVNFTTRALRPNIMDYNSDTMKSYLRALNRGDILSNPSEVPGLSLTSFDSKDRLAAWMSGHCPTYSRREELVEKLQHYLKIDVFGSCGMNKTSCGRRSPFDTECWIQVLRPKYLFYFSMENSLCDEYITEKLYLPLFYGLVPVVYGGSNYSKFLPPHSYIDASQHSPKELAKLILKIQKDAQLYARYHLWRKFWTVHVGGSFCELCHKLHADVEHSERENIFDFRKKNEKCFNYSSVIPFMPEL